MNYQKLVIVGNATRDAEHKTSKSGEVTYTTFRLAVSDRKERSVFFPITVFGKQAEVVAQYVTKGRQVLKQRIGSVLHLREATALWTQSRNDQQATIDWQFDVTKARIKLAHLDP
jgi:hypothetical protein